MVWGASFILIAKGLSEGLEPGLVTWLRILFGFAAVSAMPAARSRIQRADLGRVAAMSVTWLAFPMTLFPIAQQHVSSSVAGMLNGGIPIFATLFISVVLRRLPHRMQMLGILTGVGGIVAIGVPTMNDGGSSAVGVILVVVATVSYGVAITINVPLVQRYGALVLFRYALGMSLVLTAPGAMLAVGSSEFTTRGLMAMVMLGVGGTAIAFVCMSALSGRVGGTRASIVTYLEAIVALALGVVLKGEDVAAVQLVGCAMLLFGAWLASRAEIHPA